MTAIGGLLAVQAVAWEFARVVPDYRFIVEPWAIRGYSTTQGWVISTVAAGIVVLAVSSWPSYTSGVAQRVGIASAVGVWVAGIVIAAVSAPDPREISLNTVVGFLLSLVAGFIVAKIVSGALAERVSAAQRRGVLAAIWIVGTIVIFVAVIDPNLVDNEVDLRVWVMVAVGLGAALLLAVSGKPRELAINRVLIVSTLVGWGIVTVTPGALRSTLLRLQAEGEAGVAAQYKDTQMTSGVIIAWIGMGLAFAGAVALWAKRRDQLIAQKRAEEQAEAAAKSAAELAAAERALEG